ncbi:hypothetical protein QBC40DRAFT_303420 [Triangularia verruculosa]|uniref:C2H2-type domain-containing protein n=1 Tax=Triangularia verruculosa TaxID=2587418 RepID=A0AAN6XPP5_9PEZI|nr:hypothetical protein QBC40DRAFT_303420 [Triangularia verruculosa]
MDSNDLPYTHYGQPIDQGYPVDPSLYQEASYYPGAEQSTSSAHLYEPEDNTAGTMSTPVDPRPYKCADCRRDFRRQCDLVKHAHNHSKRRKCPIEGCKGGGAETKDLHRHLWANHPDYARENDIPRVDQPCGWPGCDYYGRTDNLKRHRDNHQHWPAMAPS